LGGITIAPALSSLYAQGQTTIASVSDLYTVHIRHSEREGHAPCGDPEILLTVPQ